jgi:hypothetical protein
MSTLLVVKSSTSYNLDELHRNYFQFLSDPQTLGFVIDVCVEEGDPFVAINPGPWEIHTRRIDNLVEFESYMEKGWFNLAAMQGKLVLRPGGNPENYLRVLYAWRSFENDSILLHASGVIRDEKGYAFFGKSGSGKTTITRNAAEAIILSDDLVILRCEKIHGILGVRIFGVPFRGSLIEAQRTNASAPLSGLFSLIQDHKHQLRPMSDAEAVARLTACVPFVMSDSNKAKQVLAICKKIISRVKVLSLHFRPDPGFWSLVDG